MTKDSARGDKHFPNIGFVNPFRRLFTDPSRFNEYIERGQTAADLGCGPGYFTMPLAKRAGESGRVYAIDSNSRATDAVKRRSERKGLKNITAVTASAAHLDMIPDASVDFVLAEGLLCSAAPCDHEQAVSEIKRILKPGSKAYLSAARGERSYMCDDEWEGILEGFNVVYRDTDTGKDFTALVSKKA
jgi:ubiquinone/menaquinone biosynthesis C-methylase UbiE